MSKYWGTAFVVAPVTRSVKPDNNKLTYNSWFVEENGSFGLEVSNSWHVGRTPYKAFSSSPFLGATFIFR